MKTLGMLFAGLLVMVLLTIAWGTLMHAVVARPYSVILSAIGGGFIGGFGMSVTLEWIRWHGFA